MPYTGLESMEEPRRVQTLDVTVWLLCAVFFVEGADVALLPASYRALETDIGLTPSGLALMAMCQAVVQSASAPVWGVLVDSGTSGKRILVLGSLCWGILTLLLAGATSLTTMVMLRLLNGLALATLTPVSQAIVADITAPAQRGSIFGLTGFTRMLGMALASLLTTSMSQQVLLGYRGWRVAFAIVAILSLLLGLALQIAMKDHRRPATEVSLTRELAAFGSYFRTATFMYLVLQGCFGSVPWSVQSFMTMFFQYCGISDYNAGLLLLFFNFSSALGNLLGGIVGDQLAKINKYRGRAYTAQLSVLLGMVTFWAIMRMPRNPGSTHLFGFLLLAFGLTATWCSAGCNKPAMIEVVPPSGCGKVSALLQALEGSSAALFGAPVVGFLAEHVFHYKPQHLSISEMPINVAGRPLQDTTSKLGTLIHSFCRSCEGTQPGCPGTSNDLDDAAALVRLLLLLRETAVRI
eukprot:TRINITY_DN16447_c0_g1_i1.p1 TRINITY_DN16447_c0_g1~~TRINITY_DN16447_c0_g1_i1.p1  ORF type:complete len:465 (+),score=81.60 TRINITY_DN16447_c0_g1_i1:157-1551(+)